MKDPPYIFACFSKLKDKENRQKHMADPLKCKNVLPSQSDLILYHKKAKCRFIVSIAVWRILHNMKSQL